MPQTEMLGSLDARGKLSAEHKRLLREVYHVA